MHQLPTPIYWPLEGDFWWFFLVIIDDFRPILDISHQFLTDFEVDWCTNYQLPFIGLFNSIFFGDYWWFLVILYWFRTYLTTCTNFQFILVAFGAFFWRCLRHNLSIGSDNEADVLLQLPQGLLLLLLLLLFFFFFFIIFIFPLIFALLSILLDIGFFSGFFCVRLGRNWSSYVQLRPALSVRLVSHRRLGHPPRHSLTDSTPPSGC